VGGALPPEHADPPGAELTLVALRVRPHGVRGEVRFQSLSGVSGRFRKGTHLVWRKVGEPDRPLTVSAVRESGDTVYARFDQIPDRTAAESLIGGGLWAEPATSPPLEPDTYYHHQLLGLTVADEAGETLGRLVGIFPGAHDNYEVETPDGRRFLVPAVAEFVREVDLAGGRMVIRPIPGLLPEAQDSEATTPAPKRRRR
jgi:16S rRNA processing protein RimM